MNRNRSMYGQYWARPPCCPIHHQPTAFLEQVRAVISALDFAADSMSQRLLGNDLGKVCPLAHPIAERRPEAVHGRAVMTHATQQFEHAGVCQLKDPITSLAGETRQNFERTSR